MESSTVELNTVYYKVMCEHILGELTGLSIIKIDLHLPESSKIKMALFDPHGG